MQRSVTAIYRTHATAALVRDELAGLGIPRGQIDVIAGHDTSGGADPVAPATTADPAGTPGSAPRDMSGGIARSPALGVGGMGAGTGLGGSSELGGTPGHDETQAGARSDALDDAVDRIHDLALPEDDTRIYQQAVRNGDHVVCVHLDDTDLLARVQEIMRRPEDARNLAELDDAHAHAAYAPRRAGDHGAHGPDTRGTRDIENREPGLRSYSRHRPLPPRGGMS